ncbi:methyltransferase domain-containing protein [Chitinophaga lutea]
MQALDQTYWNTRYERGETEWDMGEASAPLRHYFDQLPNKNLRILIPGGGNSYEAKYLWDNGFRDVTVLDISSVVVERLKRKHQQTGIKFIQGDFFEHEGEYDLIVEQTFLSALDPVLRQAYARHMYDLLWEEGRLIGVLFNREFDPPGPPFGGGIKIYRRMFQPYFHFKTFAPCNNSHPARHGKEVFINFQKLDPLAKRK